MAWIWIWGSGELPWGVEPQWSPDGGQQGVTSAAVIVANINLFYRKIISRGQVYDLSDLFSSKADTYDADGVCKVIDTNLSRLNEKGYGIKYLLECLKVDDPAYYKQITRKDMIIDSANDDIGASEIVVNYYREFLIICKGVLYVKDDDIWINSEKQVDKLLIDMIEN